jgi:hypothetical protein
MELTRGLVPTLCGAAALMLAAATAQAGDYVLEIDGQKVELDLDRPAKTSIGDHQAKLVLHQKPEQTWREEGVSFVHPTANAPARRSLGKNVTQTLMATPSGSLVIVQHYIGTNPTGLIDMMIGKMTDDEVQAGFKRSIKSATRKLSNGVTLTGKLAHTEHPGDTWDREVVAVGDRDGGFLVVAALNDFSPDSDHAMLDQFWRSLYLAAGKSADLEPLE